VVGQFPLSPNRPRFYREFESLLVDWSETIQVGILVFLLVENAIVEMRLALAVRYALPRTIIVIGDGEYQFVATYPASRNQCVNAF